MSENTKYFWGHLPIVGVFALAAATATALYTTTADYTTYSSAVKVYSIGWFAACILSFYCGLLVVPRSLGIVFSFAGTVAFTLVCAMDPGILFSQPILAQIIQALPAVFFIAAWAAVSIASNRSENKKIRICSWLWMAIFLVLLSGWVSFHIAQQNLIKQRNAYISDASEKTLMLVDELNAHKQANGAYPPTLADAGIAPEAAVLPLTGRQIKYRCLGTDFALTFADPIPHGHMTQYSYDTSHDGWFGANPENARLNSLPHMFLGYLKQR